ncbi:MAG: hypothetical protein IKA64_01975 [Clostridia bacterium]|nr:hypothetical protein [Clostridia bacterium]
MKQIIRSDLEQFAIDIQAASQKATDIFMDEITRCRKDTRDNNNFIDYGVSRLHGRAEHEAKILTELGYRKAAKVALEEVDRFQCELRHIFLVMCNGENYNTLNLLQIDSAIESLFDDKCAELKKKYTEEGK